MVISYQNFSWSRLYVSLQFAAINLVFIKPLMKVNLQLQELLIFLKVCDLQSLFVFVFVLLLAGVNHHVRIFLPTRQNFLRRCGASMRDRPRRRPVYPPISATKLKILAFYSDFQLFFFVLFKNPPQECVILKIFGHFHLTFQIEFGMAS